MDAKGRADKCDGLYWALKGKVEAQEQEQVKQEPIHSEVDTVKTQMEEHKVRGMVSLHVHVLHVPCYTCMYVHVHTCRVHTYIHTHAYNYVLCKCYMTYIHIRTCTMACKCRAYTCIYMPGTCI